MKLKTQWMNFYINIKESFNLKLTFLFIIKCYQYGISPLKPATCKFYPTCSCYGFESIQKFGPLKGFFLTLKRFFKCHPFSKGGFDPVPQTFSNDNVVPKLLARPVQRRSNEW